MQTDYTMHNERLTAPISFLLLQSVYGTDDILPSLAPVSTSVAIQRN